MSSFPIPCAVSARLPAVNIHPLGHGHKKGSPFDATASSSSTAAQIPVGSTQNLFGSLFNSLRQIIGAQPVPASTTPGTTGNSAAGSAAGAAAAAVSKINVMA